MRTIARLDIVTGISKAAPALIIILGVGVVGFVISLGWSKAVGASWDRDKIVFLAKLWGGLTLAGFVMVFVAL
jgi:hypothetical protein